MSAHAQQWLGELDLVFAETLARVSDNSLTDATELPGWTRAHVVAHVHFNAHALCRLVGWARTGAEAAMYSSADQRAAEIEHGARTDPALLRALVNDSSARFMSEFAALTPLQRERTVVTAQGRHIPAAELAWLRCRELGVHSVDLGVGTSFADLPSGFVDALVTEIVTKRLASGEGPSLVAWLTGREPSQSLARWL